MLLGMRERASARAAAGNLRSHPDGSNAKRQRGGPNVDVDVFSFVTTLPNRLTGSINPERSPASLLSEPEAQIWLTGTAEQAFGLIETADPERLRIVQSGFDKEDLWSPPETTAG